MNSHQDWSTKTFDLPALAADTGPFPKRDWLRTWWKHRGAGDLLLADDGESLLPLVVSDDLIRFAGEADLTDYHSPLGTVEVSALQAGIAELPHGITLELDSLPEEAATAVATALLATGLQPRIEQHDVAAVLSLPKTFDDYLAGLRKKDRHELRRKRRRFDSELGESKLERRNGPEAVALFARLHRLSAGEKGSFMTDDMEQFFLALHVEAGGVIDVLLDGAERPAAAIFSFEDDCGFYLYNSAFEPEVRLLSPGNVMLSHLIERSIERGHRFFDFLKGDEAYKFRLGAIARPLFVVTATIGSGR